MSAAEMRKLSSEWEASAKARRIEGNEGYARALEDAAATLRRRAS